MSWRNTFILPSIFAFVIGCSDEVELPAPSREPVHETDGYAPVVSIHDDKERAGPCTGTLISAVAIISAAHCFPRGKKNIYIENHEFSAQADVVDMLIAPSRKPNPHDIAILKITRTISGRPTFYRIGSHIDIRNVIRLVGYGHLHDHRDFKKRTGTNVVFEKNDFLEIKYAEPANGIRGAVNRAGGTEGDSGGPWLHHENGEYFIVGLIQSRDMPGATTYGVDLTRPEHRTFIQKVNNDHELEIPAF